jgi:hypothetical protein
MKTKKEKQQIDPCKHKAKDPYPKGEPDDIKAAKIEYGQYRVYVKLT